MQRTNFSNVQKQCLAGAKKAVYSLPTGGLILMSIRVLKKFHSLIVEHNNNINDSLIITCVLHFLRSYVHCNVTPPTDSCIYRDSV
jgi:hypothetical protein